MARKKQLNSESETTQTPKTTKREMAAKPKTTAEKTPRKPLARRTTKTEKTRTPEADQQSVAGAVTSDPSSAINAAKWHRIDLHLHTPGSHDYEEPDKTYLDILKQAEKRGLSMIAFTDHNTVNGYRNMMNEIEHLEYLERLGRIQPNELWRLNEYRRLLKKIVVLPGFEFTATFGFHILGIFPPKTPLRDIERVLMDLRVPGPVLDDGLTEAGATSDVLAAYEAIDEAGGIAIAAHANSSNGVSMRGMNLGGQTRIAFTQDPHLYAIEFTDLEKGRHSSAHLFTGIKPEYPRRMFAIQGSDAHRLAVAKENVKRLGVGERPTEVQLDEVNFDALKALFRTQDFHHVRPVFTVADVPDDSLALARQNGQSATAAFYPSLLKRGDRFEAILRDIAAMANGDGGSVFIGCDAGTNKKVVGVSDVQEVTTKLSEDITARISPHLSAHIGVNDADGAKLVVVRVPAGTDAPYLFDSAHFLVRPGVETRAATRDEIVAVARRGYEKIRLNSQQQPQLQSQPQTGQQQPRQDQRQQHDNRRQPNQSGRNNQQRQPQRYPDQGPERQDRRQPQQGQGQRRNQPSQQNRPPQQRNQGGRPQHQPNVAAATQPNDEIELQMNQTPIETVAVQLDNGTGATPATTTPVANGSKANAMPTEAQLPGMPRTGVQVSAMEERNGVEYFTVRDLRNNSMIRNVTKKSARDLWHYAVTQHAEHRDGYDPATIDWAGDSDRAVLSREMRAGKMRSDLAMLSDDGRAVVFYGVTDDGVDAEWKTLIADFEAARAVNVADASEDE